MSSRSSASGAGIGASTRWPIPLRVRYFSTVENPVAEVTYRLLHYRVECLDKKNLTHAEFLDAFSGKAFCEPVNSTMSVFAAP